VREFTRHASHELKTPLTVIRAQLESALCDGNSGPVAQQAGIREALDEVQHLACIVEGLTFLTKADAGLVQLKREPVQLDALMRECLENAEALAQTRALSVSLDAVTPVVVQGDEERLRQMLLNLTDNAVKYNCEGGQVVMALRRANGMAELTIANSGEGIPPELLPRVFERFVRSDTARVNVAGGCGLGLPIAAWIARAHGGEIQIASTPGQSTLVTVKLPLF
jgi:signal transduction histidine kinase